jgi:hypothetical protein
MNEKKSMLYHEVGHGGNNGEGLDVEILEHFIQSPAAKQMCFIRINISA